MKIVTCALVMYYFTCASHLRNNTLLVHSWQFSLSTRLSDDIITFLLKGFEAQKPNFYGCCDLTKKLYSTKYLYAFCAVNLLILWVNYFTIMTVSYSEHVFTSTGHGIFLRLLCRWTGSIYKLVWRDLVFYVILYSFLSFLYRFVLPDQGMI